jgi:glycosyltransferase involved in cell wall biosynthesis
MIYINGRFLCKKMDGISRFSLELCKQLKYYEVDFIIVVPENYYYENKEGFEIINYGKRKSHLWEQIDLLKFLRSKDSPLLLNFSGLGPMFYNNQIITIHDLSFYENKKWFSIFYTFFYSIATPIAARSARKILTVSNFSKSEIIKYLKVDSSKIEVIYNAVSDFFTYDFKIREDSSFKTLEKFKYILAVSSIDPRKNLQFLIKSFEELDLDGYKLVLVGKSSSHFNVILKTDSSNIIFTGFVSDAELSFLYKNADLFVYPSLYEGFGIPPLEAMKNNCAVILSNIPSLKEVYDDAALYINPNDISDLKNSILKFINNPILKDEFIKKGYNRTKLFTWEISGEKLYNILKEIIF